MSTAQATTDAVPALPVRIGGRYDIHELLGRGGMAVVYRATDSVERREIALKQLLPPRRARDAEVATALFEREFHTLAELSHPRIIEIYDYGIDSGGAYYTMELLDGGDLRDRSPVPWREACALAYEICSSLALIHSRRLVHRDISPRNIRCTRDGRAKLIDFGAMVPMGQGALIVGTPAFVSPEVVHGAALDARADLFSLGATLYFALTGRPAHPAREFAQLAEVWATKPAPPSTLVADVPEQLDALVASLLSLDPSMRPQTAFDVMHQLSAIAGLARVEPEGVSRGYLTAPAVVGRESVLKTLRAHLARALRGRGRSVLLRGAPGVGRSRMLDTFGLEAKTRGATVLRAGARTAGSSRFAVAQAIAEQLVRALPDTAIAAASADGVHDVLFEVEPGQVGKSEPNRPRLVDFAEGSKNPRVLQEALEGWFLRVSRDQPLAVAIDDVDRVDGPSGALIATLASQASRHRLLVVATGEVASSGESESTLAVLSGRSATLTLEALTLAETEELLKSVFGDVPGVGLVSDGLHRISFGNPRTCMDLAQHLVDRGKVVYDAGTWTLPSRLDATDLPQSAEAAIRARIDDLSSLSRFIAEAQALSISGAFVRQGYALLCPDASPSRVDQAISELMSQQILTSDGRTYGLAHEGWASALRLPLSDAEKVERHSALVRVWDAQSGLAAVHHLLCAGDETAALERLEKVLLEAVDGYGLREQSQLPTITIATIIEDGLRASLSLDRKPREINELRRWVTAMSPSSDNAFHARCAPAWLKQLSHDSGLDRWRDLESVADPAERRSLALSAAYEEYGKTPESERVYAPDEAIKGLVQYVIFSIAVGSRLHDVALIKSLPPLLEPFVPLSPAIEAIWNNALATDDHTCTGRPEAARQRWLGVLARIEGMTEEQLPYVGAICRAIESGIGSACTHMGLASAIDWVERLEKDNLHDVNALYLRKAMRLQVGDWTGAEEVRRQAELLALRAHTRQMFASASTLEITAHAMGGDLMGLKQVMDRVEPFARRSPGWRAYHHLAEGYFCSICGQHERAIAAFDEALALATPDPADPTRMVTVYPEASAGRAEALIQLGRVAEAKDAAERALAVCIERGISVLSHHVSRALALAEANAGDYPRGSARLEEVIREQTELGVRGLLLGATYEARARIAIWAEDTPAVERFGRLTAEEYRHGHGSPLAARYQRLIDEARTSVARKLPQLWQLEATRAEEARSARESITSLVSRALDGAETSRERAVRALRLLCGGKASIEAHLYLSSDAGLTLVASQETRGPPEGLREHLSEYISRELGAGNVETAIVDDLPSQFVMAPDEFRDEEGRRYMPVSLMTTVDGKPRFAGVAVLVDGEDGAHQMDAGLASTLGAHLIEIGDTTGVTPDD